MVRAAQATILILIDEAQWTTLQVKLVALKVRPCAGLCSTPPVELGGEYISGDAVTFMAVVRSPFSVPFWPLNVTVLDA